jgi:hypothetical protein
MPAHRVGERRESRIVEDDPDADGIPDYRVIITETFDAEGNLLLTSRTRISRPTASSMHAGQAISAIDQWPSHSTPCQQRTG